MTLNRPTGADRENFIAVTGELIFCKNLSTVAGLKMSELNTSISLQQLRPTFYTDLNSFIHGV